MADHFRAQSRFDASIEDVFAYHARPGAFERLVPPFDPVEVVRRDDDILVGSRTLVRVRIGPVRVPLEAVHTAYDPPHLFRDEQTTGPFAAWRHDHRFIADGDGCVLEDAIAYALPLGALGRLFGRSIAHHKLERMFGYRHRTTAADLAAHALARAPIEVDVERGPLGDPLRALLTTGGHRVAPGAATKVTFAADGAQIRGDHTADLRFGAIVSASSPGGPRDRFVAFDDVLYAIYFALVRPVRGAIDVFVGAPSALTDAGFVYRYPTIEAAREHVCGTARPTCSIEHG